MVRVRIAFLADHPELKPILAQWFYDEWVSTEGIPLDTLQNQLDENMNADRIPVTWVALHGNTPIGSVSIDLDDLPGSGYPGPWLASFYIIPSQRGQGVGRALLTHALRFARDCGLDDLYLWTKQPSELYRSLGWKTLAPGYVGTTAVTVMYWNAALADLNTEVS